MTVLTSGGAGDSLTYPETRGAHARQQPRGGGMDYTPPVRTGAFKAAGRHTARVRLLKRALVLAAVIGPSSIAIVALFNPFHRLPGAISVSGVGVSGTKITMENPKLTGVQQGGGPYEIKAKAGIQDIMTPSTMELVGVDAKVGMADRTTTHIVAEHGTYDGKADLMSLSGDVKIANTSGYTLNMKSATMDFHQGVFASHERLRVDLKGGEVAADDLAISNNGHVIAFRGHIASTFEAPEEGSGTAIAREASR